MVFVKILTLFISIWFGLVYNFIFFYWISSGSALRWSWVANAEVDVASVPGRLSHIGMEFVETER